MSALLFALVGGLIGTSGFGHVTPAAVDAVDMEILWRFRDGTSSVERRTLIEKDGVAVFSLLRAEIVAKGAKSVELTPDFARAKKGDRGFWAVSSGETGTFRCDEGKLDCNRWQLMSFYGMQTPERTFVAIVRKLKYYFTTRVVAEKGAYRISCVLEKELASRPYEDLEIEFRRLEGGGGLACGHGTCLSLVSVGSRCRQAAFGTGEGQSHSQVRNRGA